MMTRHRPVGCFWSSGWRSNLLASAGPISVLLAIGMAPIRPAQATPQPEAIQGIPQQIVPQAAEVGLGNFTIQTGTAVFGGSGSGSSGSGSLGTSSGEQTDSDSLTLMDDQSWGAAASQNAESLGVNATALAATCQIESQCQNVSGSGSITGAFQMSASTYNAMLQAALQQNPSLASTIVQGSAGMNDPATESIAASEYLLQGAQYLADNGISDPTVLQVRGYYNFGPAGGAAIANSPSAATMSSVLTMYTPAQLASNGITSGETVGQWQASVATKIGNSASAPVLG